MDVSQKLSLLGGLSPQAFMKRHWQKKPLLIRQAITGFRPLLERASLFGLAESEAVESRLVVKDQRPGSADWRLKHGPFQRRALPALKQPGWTLLVQGVDLHHAAVHDLLQQFRFVPDARLDDVMVSFATDGGGVGPHFDSYDVFLLQAFGQRRWRIGRQKDVSLQPDVPLKILSNFVPEQEFVLEPGDMLYLPPRYAHDGVAMGECMTYSIGFRVPQRGDIARELLQRLAEDAQDVVGVGLYRDATQEAVAAPAQIPSALYKFAHDALQDALQDPAVLWRALGEYLTEPKANVWFEPGAGMDSPPGHVMLDRRTRMMYDEKHVFINGEAFEAAGRDAILMRCLADERTLPAKRFKTASAGARALLKEWNDAGWIHGF